MTWLSVLAAVRRIPLLAWAVACVVGAGVWHLHRDTGRVTAAYAKGRADVLTAARFDSALVATTERARARASARVDTVRDTVRAHLTRTVRVADRIPDTVRVAFPVVDTLVAESRQLAASVDSLLVAHDAERNAATVSISLLTSQVQAARLTTIREHDARVLAETALSRRPRWRTVASGVVIGAAVGAAVVTFR